MSLLNDNKIVFETQCVVDEAKIFYYNDQVYRAIYNHDQASLYNRIFNEIDFELLFDAGLIRTKINKNIKIENCDLVLEHEKIAFFIDPCEMTDKMFWDASLCFIRLNKILSKYQLLLKDAHPWNITYHLGRPVFFDFSSISNLSTISTNWLKEFYTYFIVPVFLSHSKWRSLAQEYRRQHINGFGLYLADLPIIKKIFFKSFFRLSKYCNNPEIFLSKLEIWILKHRPKISEGIWDTYEQGHNTNFSKPITIKQKFIYNILKDNKPSKVADLATNKGYFAFIAEYLGAKVIGFDYEAPSIDTAINSLSKQNITFCQMNFLTPTPQKGWGLLIPDAFQRYKSDIAMGLGLIHHVCLLQRFPVKLFCDSCARFAEKGVILEFVYPEDVHVKAWNVKIPEEYNKQSICSYFGRHFAKFEESEIITDDGIKRQFFYFFN